MKEIVVSFPSQRREADEASSFKFIPNDQVFTLRQFDLQLKKANEIFELTYNLILPLPRKFGIDTETLSSNLLIGCQGCLFLLTAPDAFLTVTCLMENFLPARSSCSETKYTC